MKYIHDHVNNSAYELQAFVKARAPSAIQTWFLEKGIPCYDSPNLSVQNPKEPVHGTHLGSFSNN